MNRYRTCRPLIWVALLALFSGALRAIADEPHAAKSNDGTPSQWQPPRSFDDLPVVRELPPLLRMADGRRVTTRSMWARRRAELKDIIQYFEYGRLPPKPDHVATESVSDRALANGIGIEQRMTLVIGSDRRLTMQIAIARPRKPGRLPVIVAEVHAISPLPCIPMFVRRGYMFVQYQREDLDPDLPAVLGPAQKAYPEYDWATLAVWAWGAMRVADYLESRDDVDVAHIAVTGHSRGGKAALLAGALDERFALVAPNGSGCGGAGCFRNTPRRAESLAQITDPKRFGYWFHPRLRWFAGREERLPFDQHFLKALVAPRSLLCTEARGDLWANPSGTRRTSLAAQAVFQFLEVPDRNGLHWRDGRHDQTLADWKALLEFAEWQFFGRRPDDVGSFAP